MNVMSMQGWDELEALVDAGLADEAVKGIVITSGKDSFAGGMDLNVIARMKERRATIRRAASSTGSCGSTASCARSSGRAWTRRR